MDTALHIPDPSTSYATYAEFEAKLNLVQFYSLAGKAGSTQYIELDVPSIESSREFAPVLMLIGPGLPGPSVDARYLLDFYGINLTAGQGALSWNYTGPLDDEEFEPFTQVVLLKRQVVNVTLPDDGTYYIAVARPPVVVHPNDSIIVRSVEYILVTGILEKFTILDYILIPIDWIRGHLFWKENPIVFLLPTYLITGGAVAFAVYMRRSRPTPTAIGARASEQAVFYSALVGGLLMLSGGVNQLAFLFSNPLFSLGTGETIVLLLQGVGIVLGVVAVRLSFFFLKPAKLYRVLVAVVIFIAALIVGSGFIVGPTLFLSAAVAGYYVFRPKPPA